jgi:hypothetical protein
MESNALVDRHFDRIASTSDAQSIWRGSVIEQFNLRPIARNWSNPAVFHKRSAASTKSSKRMTSQLQYINNADVV